MMPDGSGAPRAGVAAHLIEPPQAPRAKWRFLSLLLAVVALLTVLLARYLRNYEYAVFGLAALLIASGIAYGRALSRRATASLADRKKHLAAIQISEERFRLLSSASPVGIFQTDRAGSCVYTNPPLQTILGLSEVEALGNGWAKAIHPEDRQRVLEAWSAAARRDQEFEDEVRLLTPDGKVRWVNVHSKVLVSETNESVGHVGVIEDITTRKAAEEALRASEKRYRDLVENSQGLICTHDLDGVRIEDLQAVLEYWGGWVQGRAKAAAASSAIDPEVMRNLKSLLDGDAPELLDELVELYLQDSPVQLSGLIGAIQRGDADVAADAAHALKGSSAYMGAGALASLCSRIEKLAGARDLGEAERLLGDLETEFASAQSELQIQLKGRREGKGARETAGFSRGSSVST